MAALNDSPPAGRPEPPSRTLPLHLRPVPGLSVVEIAARQGIGPMSTRGQAAWHGDAKPCVSCGMLVLRDCPICDHCGQDLSEDMLSRMRANSGPWYVHEHVRPFPGVSLDRLIRQIRRGVLSRTTVVRGPSTYHQWRFAAETPVLSKYLGCCWACQADVDARDRQCRRCSADLDAGLATDGTAGSEEWLARTSAPGPLSGLAAAVHSATQPEPDDPGGGDSEPEGGFLAMVPVIVFGLLVLAGILATVLLR